MAVIMPHAPPVLSMKLRTAALTDIGHVRRQNEDQFLCDDALAAYGVADGVGGLPAGALAARMTIEALHAALNHASPQAAVDLVPLVQQINADVTALGEQINPGTGIGTTLTFGVCTGGRLLLAHVGDSRCYRLRQGRFELLTEDHSVENEARHRRARGETADYEERYRQALTRCIGQPMDPAVDVSEHPLAPGDTLLFATDGIARVLPEADMARIIGENSPPGDRLATLVEQTNERGGPDNATAVLVVVDAA